MSRLKLPPKNLPDRDLPIYTLRRRRGALLRLAWADPASHLPFRRDARYRFDSPDGRFGVVYAAFDLDTAFVETLLRDKPASDAGPGVMLDYRDVRDRCVVTLDTDGTARPLHLVRLYGDGLAALGTDTGIFSVDDYDTTRTWAASLHAHPARPDGIVYLSRFLAPRRSVVLFDQSSDALRIGKVSPLLRHRELPRLLDRFHIGIMRP